LKRTSGRKRPELFPSAWRLNDSDIGGGDFLPFSRRASISFRGFFKLKDQKDLRHDSRLSMSMLALVIDDSMLIRHAICRYLETRGFEVETASNGIAALEALKSIRPDLILTDLQMPKLTGYQLIDALKANQETAAIPVLILAAKPAPGNPMETRAHTFIYKDLNVEEQLNQALKNLFPPRAAN
jgi:CheY-like chemotaxis protein